MTKTFHTRLRFGFAALALLLLAAASAYWWHTQAAQPLPQGDASAAMLAELQRDTQPWTAHRADLSTLVGDIRGGRIASLALSDDAVYVSTQDQRRYWLADQSGRLGEMILRDYGSGTALFPISLYDTAGETPWYRDLRVLLPLLLVVLLGAGLIWHRLRSTTRLKHRTGITFADVVGAAEAKQALRDVTAYLRDPAAFAALGARPPRGVLLTGEPGTGKTQLARALAGECAAHFIQVTGSDFSSMYFGVGIHKVKALFRTARQHAPCIVFIDEIDGIGKRAEQSRASDAESNRIINQFLTEMDGFAADSGVLVLGATNFPNSLDPALLREGRFDRSIAVGLPTLAEREQLFHLYAGKVRTGAGLDLAQLARNSVGLTPAAIASIVNQAALLAARDSRNEVTMQHFVDALETSRIGEQPSGTSPLSEAERTRIAVHEAGHALVAAALGCGRVEKVTILPRGQALGVTLITPTEDKRLYLESELRARIQMLLGGRVAEQLHFQEVSSGAGHDLHEASKLALSMVATLGMGPKGSLLNLQAVREAHLDSDPREALEAADQLLHELNLHCTELLRRLRPALERITRALLEQETIPGELVQQAIAPLRDAVPPRPCTGTPHLERVAASDYQNFDPMYDLAQTDEEAMDSAPGMA